MASVTSVGTGSGLDLESLLSNILTAERSPTESRLNLEQAQTEANISAYGSLKSTLVAFQDSLDNLKTASFFSNREANSGDSDIVTATATSTATLTSYNVAVTALAQESKVATNGSFTGASDTVGEGTITIGFVGGSSFDISVSASITLSGIRDAINDAADNIGVTASLINIDANHTELLITSDDSGASNQIDISVSDTGDGNNTDGNGLSRFYFDGSDPDAVANQASNSQTAQDATIIVDNITLTSSTNTFDSAISGVTFTAVAESADAQTTTKVTIGKDTTSVKDEVTKFAASYNELMIVLNTLTDYDATSKTRGTLNGDASVRLIEQQIRSVSGDFVEGAPSDFNSLAFIGFQTNQNGTIKFDSDALDDALDENFDNFVTLFTGDNGVANKLDDLLDSFLTADGIIDSKEGTLQEQLDEIDEKRLDLEFRLEKIENRFRSQFAALDILVSQLNQTGDFLQQQLAASANIVNGSD